MGASILLVLVTFCTHIENNSYSKKQCIKEMVGCYNASSQQYPDDRMQECLVKYQ